MAKIDMCFERRRATFTAKRDDERLGIESGDVVTVYVFGCFQCVMEDGRPTPLFVVELENGMCTYVTPDTIQFLREDE